MLHHLAEDLDQLLNILYSSKLSLSLLLQNINVVLLISKFLLEKTNNNYVLNLYPFIYL